MSDQLRILLLEDQPADAELVLHELRRAGFKFDWQRVSTEADYLAGLDPALDLILADYSLPQFTALRALQLLLDRRLDIPFIVVTGTTSEEAAIECMQLGAADYLLKDRLARLGQAVNRALERTQQQRARRQAEATLRENEARLSLIFNNTSDLLALSSVEPDFSLKISTVNNAYLETCRRFRPDLAEQDVVGHDRAVVLRDVIGFDPGMIENETHLFRQAAETRQPVEYEVPLVGPNGAMYLAVSIVPVFDDSGVCSHMLWSARDISSRKHIEEALQESEAFANSILNSTSITLAVLDFEGCIIAVNESWRKFAWENSGGKPVRSELGVNYFDVCRTAGGPDAEGAAQVLRGLLAVRNGLLREFSFEYPCHSPAEQRWFVMHAVPRQGAQGGLVISHINVTNLKYTEAALRKSEEKYRTLFSEMMNGFALNEIVCDEAGRPVDYVTLEVNSAFETLLNTTRQAVVGQPASAILPQEELTHWLAVFGPVALTGKSTRYEMYSPFNQRYFEGSAYRPEPGKFAVTFSDITERKHTEDQIRRSAIELKKAQAVSHVGSWVWDIQHNTLEWSDEMYRIFGIAKEEFSGSLPDVIAHAIHPDDRAEVERSNRSVIEDHKPIPLEYRIIWPDQSVHVVWGEAGELAVDPTGTPAFLRGIVQDITERKQYERELEALVTVAAALRAAPARGDMLPVIADQALSLLKADAVSLIMSSPSTTDNVFVLARGDWADWAGAHVPVGTEVTDYVLTSGQPITRRGESIPGIPWPDQVGEIPLAACVPLIAEGQVIAALWIGRRTDLTVAELRSLMAVADIAANALHRAGVVETLEQRVADRTRQLVEANTQLQELDQMKDQFVSNVSHELRTPLANLKLYLSLLDRGKPEKRGEYMETLRREHSRLDRMIEDLLDLSRLDMGVTPIRPVPTDLNLLLSQLIADRAALAAEHQLVLDYQPDDDLPLALIDPVVLTEVITNLVGNAINYTPRGGMIIVVTAVCEHEGQLWATFTVQDTGLGISAKDLPHLFERFYRGEVGRKAGAPGSGLGLAISKEIVEKMGGRIFVESEPGQGAAFTVWLKPVDEELP